MKMKNSHKGKVVRGKRLNMQEDWLLNQKQDSMIISYYCWTSIVCIPLSYRNTICASLLLIEDLQRTLITQKLSISSKIRMMLKIKRSKKKKQTFLTKVFLVILQFSQMSSAP